MTENITMESFQGITVRCVNQDGRKMMPVVDVANAVKMDRSNLTKHMKKNEEYYAPYKGVVKITTTGGEQHLVCLTRDGILGLLFKVNASHSKDAEIKKRIIEFQHWATELLGQRTVGQPIENPYESELPLPSPNIYKNATEIVNEQLDIADTVIKRIGIPKEQAQAYAMILAGDKAGMDFTCYATAIKAQINQVQIGATALPIATAIDKAEFESYFSLSQIAEFVKKSYNTARDDLEALGIITRTKGRIHLTKYGELGGYGKLFWIMPMSPYDMTPRPHVRFTPVAKEALMDLYKTGVEQCQLK